MSDAAWRQVSDLLARSIDAGTMPGAALCVLVHGQEQLHLALGQAELRPQPRPVQLDTAWDLASLTKILATTPLALVLSDAGVFDLDQPLVELLGDGPPAVTARHCLLHSSGLPPWRPLFEQVLEQGLTWGSASTRQRVLRRARTVGAEAAPGARHAYSDLGFLLLGAALEAAGGDRLDRLWERHLRPAMAVDLRWGWPGAAATEDCPVRRRVVAGQVHDLNAAVLGGIAPHAGLFGSVQAVARAGAWHLRVWQGERGLGLRPSTLRAAWAAAGPGSHHLGWDGVSPGGSSASERWPDDGVGHLGFTGTSLWLAPRQGVAVAFCTNRVHPVIEGGAIPGGSPGPKTTAFRALRPAVHSAVVHALSAQGLWPGPGSSRRRSR